tara:strand:- start:386 stop:868 length:483 start_codon:yes stop_codon:yes gene_type:complete
MPSFDIKSEINSHELQNGVDQANRIIDNRFDFKGSGAKFSLDADYITLSTQEEYQIHQMLPILKESLSKRGVDLKSLDPKEIEVSTGSASQKIDLKQGIDKEIGKKITQLVKSSKMKVQAAIQGETVRITGKKRDDLQDIMVRIKEENLGIPIQFENFRD